MKSNLNIHFEYHNLLFAYLNRTKKNIEEIKKRRHQIRKRVVHSFTSKYFGKGNFVKDEAINIILELQKKLEEEMQRIISQKSVYYWFHLYRRIAPVSSFKGESNQTVWLYRNILETAFLKYGQSFVKNELVFGSTGAPVKIEDIASGNYLAATKCMLTQDIEEELYGIFLGEFQFDDLFQIYSLEGIAYEYWWTTVCERRIHKGGELIVKFQDYFVKNDIETEKLMKIYDKRGGSIEDLTTTTGTALGYFKQKPILLPKYNTESLSSSKLPYHLAFGLPYEIIDVSQGEFTPNFLWIPFDFTYYYKVNQYIEEGFSENFGFSFKNFVLISYLITFQAIHFSNENGYAIDLMKRSYRHFSSVTKYADELYNLAKLHGLNGGLHDIWDMNIRKEDIVYILNELTLKENRDPLSLKTMGPRPLIFSSINEDNFIIDYAALLPILLTITHFVDLNETQKGLIFEDFLIERLKAENFNLWVSKKELKQKDGTAKEIDVSFIYKNVLFICECKSNKMSLVFGTKGDKKALDHRKRKMVKALNEVDNKVEWLLKDSKGTNYKVPEQVEYIVPIVVSPFTEYIWEYSVNLWLTDDVPRVLLPTEITSLNYEKEIEKIINKGFTRKVNK